jgi:hypothetical protein
MKPKKQFSIWVGNLEFDLIARVKLYLKAQAPKSQSHTHNADAYSGPADIGKPDLAFIQSRYPAIIRDHRNRGIQVITEAIFVEEVNERSLDRRSEGNEEGADDGARPAPARVEDPDEDRVPAPLAGEESDRLADDGHVPEPRRRGKPGRKAKGR